MSLTVEEQRAEDFRLRAKRRQQAIKERAELLRGDDEARRQLAKHWKPLLPGRCGDTSIPLNKENA